MDTAKYGQSYFGREFTAEEVSLIKDVVETCTGVSRTELAHTVCELLEWKRPNGRLKGRECLEMLERMEGEGILTLPPRKSPGMRKSQKSIAPPGDGGVYNSTLRGSVEEFTPLDVQLVETRPQRQLFKELVSRYHYLGYAMPYGARLQYLVYVSRPRREVVGCVQFSSPAWRMKVRDQWIGWDDVTRGRGLQHIVNNSRLLVVPRIRNLASMMLSCVLRQLRSDWQERYGVEPWLVETLVERQRFYGGCYRAANFMVLGETSGRGRMDRGHQRHGARIKIVLVYPLVKDAVRRLRDGG
ncbi:MAG: DUF4338 domain-containing protein [Deltaproteobacteria bacterium]|nr:DUF4338 domain-containing protein [Deltaproteobacteria bacterium]